MRMLWRVNSVTWSDGAGDESVRRCATSDKEALLPCHISLIGKDHSLHPSSSIFHQAN